MPAVRIANSVFDTICAVRPRIDAEVLAQITRLSELPRLGTPILDGPFKGGLAFDFRVDRLPVSRVFTVFYQHDQATDVLDVLDFGVRDEGAQALTTPSFEIARRT